MACQFTHEDSSNLISIVSVGHHVTLCIGSITFKSPKINVIKRQLYWAIGIMARVFANGPGDRVQSRVDSYQRLKKWYLMPPYSALKTIRYGSRVKWSNPGNGVAPSPTFQCSSYWKPSGHPRLRSPTLLTLQCPFVNYLRKFYVVCSHFKSFRPPLHQKQSYLTAFGINDVGRRMTWFFFLLFTFLSFDKICFLWSGLAEDLWMEKSY